jgi:3-keto-5-aminohexanoate cleavage enzyme
MNDYIWDYRNPYKWMNKVKTSSLPPMMVCCAITGGVHGKEANPNLPETPEEQAQQVHDAYRAGASMAHIHVRDPAAWYNCSGDPADYRKVNALVRENCPDIIINNTTGGGPGMTPDERLCVLEANPEIATLNMGPDVAKMTLKERKPPLPHPRGATPIEECMPVDYAEVAMFAGKMQQRNIKPEIEIYHPGMYWMFEDLVEQDLIDPPYLFQFVMGYQTSSYATPNNLLSLINELPANSIFEVAGLGPFQMPMVVMSVILGGHVRVGLEDNVYLKRGQLYKSNAEAVEHIVRIAKDMNREIATPGQAREMLGLSMQPSQY